VTTDEIEVLIRVVKDAGDHGRPHGIGPVTLLQILDQLQTEHAALVEIADSHSVSRTTDDLADVAWHALHPGKTRRGTPVQQAEP